MKKQITKAAALTLSFILAISLAACGASDAPAETTPAATQADDAQTENSSETASFEMAASEETTQAETEAPTVEIDYRDIDVQALAAGGASIAHTAVYGVYNMEGDAVDSAIQADVYYDLTEGQVVRIDFEEALIPYSFGGAEGWAILNEETAAALGDAVITLENGTYPLKFELGGITWTGAEEDGAVIYTADIDGTRQNFIDYVSSAEGGAWYHEHRSEGASVLDGNGDSVAAIEIGTKASISHGVDFWASPITFPGNIELIKNYIYDYGVNYDYAPAGSDIAKNDEGQWVVADVVTGATLAGTPNYLNLVKAAVDQIAAGNYDTVE